MVETSVRTLALTFEERIHTEYASYMIFSALKPK